jgi:CBS domain-containing protein
MHVRDVMQTDVATLGPQADLRQLDELLLRRRIQGVPVVEDDRVVGIVSRSDVVRQLRAEESRFEAEVDFYLSPFDESERPSAGDREVAEAVAARLRQLRVRDVMTEDVISVPPDADVAEAARQMTTRRIHRLLVLEGGRLVGIVSSLDLLRLVAEGRLVPKR